MHHSAFKQVDVFTARPFRGNPVAVILDAERLDGADMQRIARWTNLSETSFVLPATQPGADYRVRIFTPARELPFAGHPSVGTAHAVLEAGLVRAVDGRLQMECGAGLLPLRVEDEGMTRRIFVRAPTARFQPVVASDIDRMAQILGAAPLAHPPPQVADNGPHWLLVQLADEASVRGLTPDLARLAAFSAGRGLEGAAVFAGADSPDYDLVVRCFCPDLGIPEDPVTGSANASIAAWLSRHGLLPGATYRASQGREMGRDGRLELRVDAGEVWVGGQSVTVIDGGLAIGD